MNNKAFQFKVVLMNLKGLKEHIVNCVNIESAKMISEALFPDMRVIEIKWN